jgi:hypothetical protein
MLKTVTGGRGEFLNSLKNQSNPNERLENYLGKAVTLVRYAVRAI